MLGQNNMSNITSVDIGYFVSELGSFDCMLHNSVVIHDIFMQYYLRNEYDFWKVHGIMNISGLLQS